MDKEEVFDSAPQLNLLDRGVIFISVCKGLKEALRMWARISTVLHEAIVISFKTDFQGQADVYQCNQYIQEKKLPIVHFICVYPSTVAVRLIHSLGFLFFFLVGLGTQ